jgi:ferredoxin-nitrite reductase/sulfite reductase (ferredoxin)
VPARRVPEAVDRLLKHQEQHARPGELPRAYFERLDVSEAKALLRDLVDGPLAETDYVDLNSEVAFQVVALDGECAQ